MAHSVDSLSSLNTALIGANSSWGGHIRRYAAAQEAAYDSYCLGLSAQKAQNAADEARKKAAMGLALSVVATSALIYFAGATSLKGIISDKVMKKVSGPRQILMPKYTFNPKTLLMDREFATAPVKEMSALGAFLFGTAYGEVAKHVNANFLNGLMAKTGAPDSTAATATARGGWSVENTLLTWRDDVSAQITEVALKVKGEVGEQSPIFTAIAQAPYFKEPKPHPADLKARILLAMWMSHLLDQDYLRTIETVETERGSYSYGLPKMQSINASPSARNYPSAPSHKVVRDGPAITVKQRKELYIQDTGDVIDQHVDAAYTAVFRRDSHFFARAAGGGAQKLDRANLMKAEQVLNDLAKMS